MCGVLCKPKAYLGYINIIINTTISGWSRKESVPQSAVGTVTRQDSLDTLVLALTSQSPPRIELGFNYFPS